MPALLWFLISARNLTRRFGDFTAVDNVSFEVPTGTICALLGPNGAGKSTIMKMLTGLLLPTSGDGSVTGLDIRRDALAIKQIAGVLPENLGLFNELTVEEHLALSGPIYGLSARETRDRSSQLLHALALEHGRTTFLDQCSHGMRKKTALAMALLHNPRVLFLDEPFEAVDPVTAAAIGDLLLNIARRGVTVFLTSHILSIVDKLADQIIVLRAGEIAWQGAAAELPHSLEELYFSLHEPAIATELPWLGSRQS